MPIEVKELIIRTQVNADPNRPSSAIDKTDLQKIRKGILKECKDMIQKEAKKTTDR